MRRIVTALTFVATFLFTVRGGGMSLPKAAQRTLSLFDGQTDLERPKHQGRDGSPSGERRKPYRVAPPLRTGWEPMGNIWIGPNGYRVRGAFLKDGTPVWDILDPQGEPCAQRRTSVEAFSFAEKQKRSA